MKLHFLILVLLHVFATQDLAYSKEIGRSVVLSDLSNAGDGEAKERERRSTGSDLSLLEMLGEEEEGVDEEYARHPRGAKPASKSKKPAAKSKKPASKSGSGLYLLGLPKEDPNCKRTMRPNCCCVSPRCLVNSPMPGGSPGSAPAPPPGEEPVPNTINPPAAE